MTKEQIINLYVGTSIPSEEFNTILDSIASYNMWGIFNGAGSLATIQEKDEYFNRVIKVAVNKENAKRIEADQKQYEQGTEKIDSYIKTEILSHVESIREDSNRKASNYKEYSSKCMLKAFAIEYMLKTISIISNMPRQETKNFSQPSYDTATRMLTLMKETKSKLETAIQTADPTDTRRRTGHEINELLNNIVPPHIRTLIKYRSIANYADDNIINSGIIPQKTAESLDSFIADYLLMTRDFSSTEDSSQSLMTHTATEHNAIYKKNNKAFEEYRYQDQMAALIDYNMLNSLMVATEMTLEYLLNNRSLAANINPGEIISYEMVKFRLTKEEYDHLLELSRKNSYDANDLIYYHTFLKEYLQERTPKFTDDRYSRINMLFQEIKNAGDISTAGERFAEWYKNFDMSELSKEEIKEIKLFAPQFVYNSLSYVDKLIYKKCQEAGIEFEYYYKSNLDTFTKIISQYKDQFQGKSISEQCIRRKTDTIEELSSLLTSKGMSLGTVPDYYFSYSNETLQKAYLGQVVKHPLLAKRAIEESVFLERANSIVAEKLKNFPPAPLMEPGSHDYADKLNNYEEQRRNYVRSIYQDLMLEEESKSKSIKRQQEHIEKVMNGLSSRTIPKDDNLDNDYALWSRASAIADIKRWTKTDDITPYINMPIVSLLMHHQKLVEMQPQHQVCVKLIEKSFDEVHGDKEVARNAVEQIKGLLADTPVYPEMKFLSINELQKMYVDCYNYNNSFEVGEWMLYRTSLEVNDIIKICQENNNAKLQPELLYFSPDELRENFSDISAEIRGAKRQASLNGEEISHNAIQEMRNYYSNSQPANHHEPQNTQTTELDNMFIISINPELVEHLEKRNQR